MHSGLSNIVGMVDAAPELTKKEAGDLSERYEAYPEKELVARADTSCELYSRTTNTIERLGMMVSGGLWSLPAYDECLFNVQEYTALRSLLTCDFP